MDSQENTTPKGIEEEQKAEAAAPVTNVDNENDVKEDAKADTQEQAAAVEPDAQDTAAEDLAKKVYASKKEVLDRIEEIANADDTPGKDEVDHLKASFYRFQIAERDKKQKEYLEAGGDPEKYQILPDEDEEAYKANMRVIKEKRAKAFEKAQQEREENLKHREEIIEKIKNMATSPDEANKSYNEFKTLQQEWKGIGAVPPEKSSETWRNYQLYVEQFYDLLNLNREAREYDFKKNLEAKTKLCEEAEKLADEPDVVSAFHQLQDLHEQYREIGPVAKEMRENIWTRFKNASTVINKKLLASSKIFQILLDFDSSNAKCLALADAEVAEITASEKSKITKAPVKDLKLSHDMTIGGLTRNGRGMLVNGQTQIQPGDHVLVFCLSGAIHKIEKMFH